MFLIMAALEMIRWAKIDNFTLVQTGSHRILHDLKFSTSKNYAYHKTNSS